MYKTKIEVEGTEITWGGVSWSKYRRLGNCSQEYHVLKEMLGIAPEPTKWITFESILSEEDTVVPKPLEKGDNLYQRFTQTMGCTPSAALRTLNKIMYKVWIAPIGRDVVWAYCRENATVAVKRYLNANKLVDMHTHMDKIQVCLQDNQKHLIPLCVALESTPKQIKDKVSKSIWKQIINNSLTRNGLIAVQLGGKDKWSTLQVIVQLSSSLLKEGYGRGLLVPYYLSLSEKLTYSLLLNNLAKEGKFLTKKNSLRETWDTVRDTMSMANQVGVVANPKWKLKRWHEEHDKLSRLITSRKYSNDKFTHESMYRLETSITDKGFTATLLDSKLEIALEGDKMGHCVAGYTERASEGRYAVYSIRDSSGVPSTLGLRIDQNTGIISFDQHYGKYNGKVDTATKEFGRSIVHKLGGTILTIEGRYV